MTDVEAQTAARALADWFSALAKANVWARHPDQWSASAEQVDLPRWQELAVALGGRVTYQLWVAEDAKLDRPGAVYADLMVAGVPDLTATYRINGPLDTVEAHERALDAHPALREVQDATVDAAEWLAIVQTGIRRRGRRR